MNDTTAPRRRQLERDLFPRRAKRAPLTALTWWIYAPDADSQVPRRAAR